MRDGAPSKLSRDARGVVSTLSFCAPKGRSFNRERGHWTEMVKLLFNFRFCLSLVQVDSFLLKVSTETDHHKPQQATTNVVLVTDGQLPLRQCLLPETCTKGIAEPPAVLSFFYDLRKEFRKGFPNAPEINSIQDMINRKSTIFFWHIKESIGLGASMGKLAYYLFFYLWLLCGAISWGLFLYSTQVQGYEGKVNKRKERRENLIISFNSLILVGERHAQGSRGMFCFFHRKKNRAGGKSPDGGGEGDKGLALRFRAGGCGPHTPGRICWWPQ